MTTYGLTDTGFVPKTTEIILGELRAAWRAAFGASIDVSEGSPDGMYLGIFAEREAAVWELADEVAGMMDPDKASGAPLDALCLLTGTYREDAKRSATTLTLTGDTATVVVTGSQATATSTGAVFATNESGTLVTLDAWAVSTAYSVGDRVTANGNAYVCITAGVSDAAGGPSTDAADITDNTVHWRFMGEGIAAADVLGAAVEVGPTVAVSGDITTIATAVSGWSGVINLLDANPGTYRTSNQGLRLLREFELAASGASPVPAIRRALLRVEDVESVSVFYNNTDATDADGVPPHGVEVLVQGGDDDAIREALFAAVAGGITTAGTTSGTVTDDEGTVHTIKFSRPVEVPIYVTITVEVDASTFPVDGANQIKLAIVEWGDLQPNGRDARASIIGAQAFIDDSVMGISATLIDDTPAPATSATIAVSLRERATYDTSRITVNTTPVVP